MAHLRTCDACLRHVRSTETTCPFCEEPLAPARSRARVPVGASRAAQFAAAVTVLGCTEEKKPEPAKTSPDTALTIDSTPIDTYVPEPPDTAVADTFVAEAATDTAPPRKKLVVPTATATVSPTHTLAKPYGAPPADGLLEV